MIENCRWKQNNEISVTGLFKLWLLYCNSVSLFNHYNLSLQNSRLAISFPQDDWKKEWGTLLKRWPWILRTNEWFVVVPCWWWCERLRFGIKRIDEGQTAIVNRLEGDISSVRKFAIWPRLFDTKYFCRDHITVNQIMKLTKPIHAVAQHLTCNTCNWATVNQRQLCVTHCSHRTLSSR